MKSIRHVLMIAALLGGLTLSMAGDDAKSAEKEKDLKVIKGKGLCAKCELGQADSCQTAIQTEQDGKKVLYLLAPTDAAGKFHKHVCQGTKPVWAKGKVKKKGDERWLAAKKIGVQKEVALQGVAMCAKCELGKADKCQNVLQAKNDKGKKVLYFLDANKVSKDFHGNVCQGTAKVKVKGTMAKIGDRRELTASKIEKL